MNYTLKIWRHPQTNEIRVYVNSKKLWQGTRLFFYLDTNAGIENFANYRISGAESAQDYHTAQELANSIGQEFSGEWNKILQKAD